MTSPSLPPQWLPTVVGFPLPRVIHGWILFNNNHHHFAISCNVSWFTTLVTHPFLLWLWVSASYHTYLQRWPMLLLWSSHTLDDQTCHYLLKLWFQTRPLLISWSTFILWMPFLRVSYLPHTWSPISYDPPYKISSHSSMTSNLP